MTPDALAALHAACFTVPRPWAAGEFASLIAAPHTFVIEAPHGFVLGQAVVGEAELLTLAVAPDARRRGTGRALVSAFLAEAVRRGAEAAFLEVAADNTAARALYAATGWHEAGRRRGYYRGASGPAVDAIVLRHPLAPA